MKIKRMLGATLALGTMLSAGIAAAQDETSNTTMYGDMSLVTQDMLSRAAGDGNNFLHTNATIRSRS